MKRILSILLLFALVLLNVQIVALASDAELISGSSAMFFCNNADTLELGGKVYEKQNGVIFTANITVSDYSSDYSFIYLNGNKLQKLANGENIIELNSASLAKGENELRLMLGTTAGTYSEDIVYGTVNIDDITVESVSFSGVSFNVPSKVNMYMPIIGSAGMTLKTADYSEKISVGDGWSAETGLGGSAPNTPVSVGFVFDVSDVEGGFCVDTTELSDGEYTAVFKSNGSKAEERKIIIDNNAPEISFSIANGASVSKLDKITCKINDITKTESTILLDGKKVNQILPKTLSVGSHTAYVTAVDAIGNKAASVLLFNVTEKKYSVSISDKSAEISVLGDASVYSASVLKDIRMFENRYGSSDMQHLRYDNEVSVSFDNKANLTTSAIGNALPYQSFVVNTEYVKDSSVLVSYTGETGNGTDIVLKAWNYVDARWDEIGSAPSGENISVLVDLATYSRKNKMRVNAMPKLVYNGSSTILWNSDTQYYSRFDDLHDFYYRINQYAVQEYNSGNIGYCVHTGDLIDQVNQGAEIANYEYKIASAAQNILDSANVPNGVVSGNHDINHTAADYSYYCKYFSEDRYKDFDWYGGSLNNNMHHYDLVSIGAYDFVFLYLGTYMEDKDDTIAWANSVCEAYPTRNVIICTHEYILPSGQYSGKRAEVIWDKIVVPNENVVMILCGHNDGVCDQMHRVGNSDRYVLEILADYQFSELGVGPQHVLNGCTCDGEGYVRLMTFNDAKQLISTTYSPVASDYDVYPYNFYPSYSDSFIYDLDLIDANRSIKTTAFDVVYNSEYVGEVGEAELNIGNSEAFYAEIKNGDSALYSAVYVFDKYEADYKVNKEPKYDDPAAPEKVFSAGLANVNENLRKDETNSFPSDDIVKVGLNLMPESASALKKTSGSETYEVKLGDNRAVTLSHENDGGTWVTLANNLFEKVDVSEYNRIYFGVTANKNAKWNLFVNFANREINFSQNKAIASMFGYVNDSPSDFIGTWNGYIDLSDITDLTGEQTLSSVYFVGATPGETVTFDYLFLGKSEGGKIRVITDNNIITAFEDKIGNTMSLPAAPYKQGYNFDGWYTAKEGGEKVEHDLVFGENMTEIYAHFSERAASKESIGFSDTEINLEQTSVLKIVIICLSLLIMVIVAIVLLIKMKKTQKKKDVKQ